MTDRETGGRDWREAEKWNRSPLLEGSGSRGGQVRRGPVDEDEGYTGIGAELKRLREEGGIDLGRAAEALRIQAHYLEAIEQGRFDELPGSAYATGFLRSYASYLGVDEKYVLARFRRESSLTVMPARLVPLGPIEEARRPRRLMVLVSLAAAAAVYAGWIYFQELGRVTFEAVPEPPERLAALLEGVPSPGPVGDPSQSAPSKGPAVTVSVAPVEADTPERGGELSAPQEATSRDPVAEALTAREAERDAAAVQEDVGSAEAAPRRLDREVGPAPDGAGASLAITVPGDVSPSAGGVTTRSRAQRLKSERNRRPSVDILPPAPPGAIGAENEVGEAADAPPTLPSLRNVATVEPVVPAQAAAAVPPPPLGSTSLPPPPPSTSFGAGASGYVPQKFGGGNSDARVVVRAKADSWVQVQGPRNELLLTRILRAGDTYHAPNRDDLVMVTGNAGALEIIVDGETLGPLGPLGAVRRDISLDADKLLTLAQGEGAAN